MANRRIDIYIKNLDVILVHQMLRDFFNRDRHPDVYITFDAKFTPVGTTGMASVTYKKFRVVEASDDEKIWNIPLATINMVNYPSRLVIFIEGIKGKEKDWKKVEVIVRKILSQMELMEFEIKSVTPASLLPKSALPAWEQIEEHASDRTILKLWHDLHTAAEIGVKVGLSTRTVTNIISRLRTKYKKGIVPTNEQRRRKKTI